jgi:hypothetical protein
MRALLGSFLAAVLIVALGACGSDPQPAAPPAGDGLPSAAPTASQPGAAPASEPARDLSAIDLCQLVKVEEVASAAGGTPATQPSWNGEACFYVIETPSDTESYLAALYPASIARALLDAQSPEEKGEKIEGAWKEAWLGPRVGGIGFTLLALRDDEIALEISGDRREVVLALAALTTERLE